MAVGNFAKEEQKKNVNVTIYVPFPKAGLKWGHMVQMQQCLEG